MSSMALTWAFTSSVAKSSGYMLTSANVIMVSVIVADFLYRKTMPTSVFSQVRIEISTQSYSNFGLECALANGFANQRKKKSVKRRRECWCADCGAGSLLGFAPDPLAAPARHGPPDQGGERLRSHASQPARLPAALAGHHLQGRQPGHRLQRLRAGLGHRRPGHRQEIPDPLHRRRRRDQLRAAPAQVPQVRPRLIQLPGEIGRSRSPPRRAEAPGGAAPVSHSVSGPPASCRYPCS